jgi:hypothetical protein
VRETHFPMRIFFFFLADATGEDNEQGDNSNEEQDYEGYSPND